MAPGHEAAVGVDGKPSTEIKVTLAEEPGGFAMSAETELFKVPELARRHGVIGLNNIYIGGTAACFLISLASRERYETFVGRIFKAVHQVEIPFAVAGGR
jgi:hypothetical protein